MCVSVCELSLLVCISLPHGLAKQGTHVSANEAQVALAWRQQQAAEVLWPHCKL